MKTKTMIFAFSSLIAGMMPLNAAKVMVYNAFVGPGDTLYANFDNSLMATSGLVTMGYFPASVTSFDIDTIPELLSKLSSYTLITSKVPGSYSDTIGLPAPGYAIQDIFTNIGVVTSGSPLLGRKMYSIVTSAPTLGAATLASEFALVEVGTIKDDLPVENTYTSLDPTNALFVPLIGTIGSFNGETTLGTGTFLTLKMSYVPEPSTALLGALGVLGALGLRRR
jgi:hypothetical protein